MKNTINSGIYNIDLHGTNDSEFYGNHPTLILKSVKNHEMYYVFPLTTYTIEKWKSCRKRGCCRITTTNSIVRIDKVKILHRLEIQSRWIKDNSFIIPKPEEIDVVYKKYKEYIDLSIDVSVKEYKKYYDNYNYFVEILYKNFYEGIITGDFIIDFKNRIIVFNSLLVYHLTYDDVKHIIYSFIKKEYITIEPDKKNNLVKIHIVNDHFLLTLKEKCGKINLNEGQCQ